MAAAAQQARPACGVSGHRRHRRQICLTVEAGKFRMCQFFWWGGHRCTGESTGGGPYLFSVVFGTPLPGESLSSVTKGGRPGPSVSEVSPWT